MKKYKLILPIALLLFIVGCNNYEKTVQTKNEEIQSVNVAEDSNDTSTKDKIAMPLVNQNNENCVITLGLTRTEVKSKLDELKVPIVKEYEIQDDNYQPSGLWMLYTKDFAFYFNINNQLNMINVNTGIDVVTTTGLKRGDTIKRMHELYGEENSYNKQEDMYVYKMKNCNFGVIYNLSNSNNTVDSWTIFDEKLFITK